MERTAPTERQAFTEKMAGTAGMHMPFMKIPDTGGWLSVSDMRQDNSQQTGSEQI